MALGTDFANSLCDHVFGGPDFTRPASLYVALYSDDPGEGGDADTNEISGTGYARVELTNDGTTFPEAVDGQKSVAVDVDFGQVGSGGWTTATHYAIVTSSSGSGDILIRGALPNSQDFVEGNLVRFPAGSLTITFDTTLS